VIAWTNAFVHGSVLDCRPHFETQLPETVLGNYSAGIFQGTRVKDDISFWDMARLISSKTEMEISKHKHFSELPVLAMLVGQVITKLPSIQKLTKLFFQGIFSCFGK